LSQVFLTGDIEVRPSERRVLIKGRPAALGGRAFDLLLALIERRDRVAGKDELMEAVWPGVAVEENNLTVQISTLRKILGNEAIATVAGRGYRFTLSAAETPHSIPATPRTAVREGSLIAVLPFDNLSSDPAMEFFSDGVSGEIIQHLSRVANLKVVSRTSSFQFRGAQKAGAGASLGCDYVVDGSIQRAAERVRVSAQLMETASRTTLWSERYDRGVEDIFAVQDDISQSIASALHRTISGVVIQHAPPAEYDLYLRSSPKSFAPDELRTSVRLLEIVTERAPRFGEAWGRVAYLRGFLHVYLPFAERPANAMRVEQDAATALSLDACNIDALAARCFIAPPFGGFIESDRSIEQLRRARGAGDGRRYIGWFMRHTGRLREALEETQEAFRLDRLDPMSINLLALAHMACGEIAAAIPLYEDLVARVPQMSFPISSLLRAHAFREDWDAVDRLLAIAATRPLREFQDTIPFVLAKRDPKHINAWRGAFEAHIAKTGWVDIARLVYAAHLGLVDDAYRAADVVRLGPVGGAEDLMGPDGYRTALLFQANMPQLRDDARFPQLCARLGLVDFWMTTDKWPDCVAQTPYDFKLECARAQDTPREAFGF
jgi:TolB-like protein